MITAREILEYPMCSIMIETGLHYVYHSFVEVRQLMKGPRIGSGALIHMPEKMVRRKRKVLWFSAVHTFDILRYLNVTFIITMTGAY